MENELSPGVMERPLLKDTIGGLLMSDWAFNNRGRSMEINANDVENFIF
jgi:hypothetical protein